MYHAVLLAHLLAATIWTGGHLVLFFTVLPRALSARSPTILLDFESGFEKIGMPALVIQIATGLWMALQMKPEMTNWFNLADGTSRLITFKLGLLLATALTAIDARFRIIPNLSPETLPAMARRIGFVTLLSVGFVLVGISFRGVLLYRI